MSGPHLLGESRPAPEIVAPVLKGIEDRERIRVFEELYERWKDVRPKSAEQLRQAAERIRNGGNQP